MEVKLMANFSKVSVAQDARTELHDKLSLTGAEVSINSLPAGASVPFIHSHKNNEEIYAVLEGKGKAVIDGEDVELAAGDWLRISPAGKRQFFAAEDSAISFICIQVKENSLGNYTVDDAVVDN
ncbi:MAG: cupin domain-containing protein [Lachnospiraceae bacterium]|nr:cupin domain-containing protein [Lachnospiraceae bacterium]